jgi:ankyrin repeat protein
VRALLLKDADVNQAEKERGFTPLHSASSKGNIEIINMLLDKGALLHDVTKIGITALHLAAYYGHVEAVETLLERGASVNQSENEGFTALHLASRKEHIGVMSALLRRQAAVNHRAINGNTPLLEAIENNKLEAAKILLANGADANQAGKDGLTPLVATRRYENYYGLHFVYNLLDNGADAETAEKLGFLHMAIKYYDIRTIKILIDKKVNVNEKRIWQPYLLTPLFLAVKECSNEIVNLLLDAGADNDIKVKIGHRKITPLDLAIEKSSSLYSLKTREIYEKMTNDILEHPARASRWTPLKAAWQGAVARAIIRRFGDNHPPMIGSAGFGAAISVIGLHSESLHEDTIVHPAGAASGVVRGGR